MASGATSNALEQLRAAPVMLNWIGAGALAWWAGLAL
jgi:hypothetical protein